MNAQMDSWNPLNLYMVRPQSYRFDLLHGDVLKLITLYFVITGFYPHTSEPVGRH